MSVGQVPGWRARFFAPREFFSRGRPLTSDAAAGYVALAADVLDPVRVHLGRPVVVNDGQRYPDHNLAVGGAQDSRHLPPLLRSPGNRDGVAADFHVPGFTIEDTYGLFLWMRSERDAGRLTFGGLEFYPTSNFIHVDTRHNRAEWPHDSGRDAWKKARTVA